MADKPKVAIAAGGTAGHINPALALAEELRERGCEVVFFGNKNKLEATLVPKAGFAFKEIHVTGFDRSRPWTLFSALTRMHAAERTIDHDFASSGVPSVGVGFGAYVELPLVNWCSGHGVPVVLHEQNSVPGLANKVSSRKASTVCVSLPAAKKAFEEAEQHGTRLVVTGNPVRHSVVDASREAGRAKLGLADDETMLLVFGGSLGASHLNKGIISLKQELLSRDKVVVVHSTGAADFDEVSNSLALTEEELRRWHVLSYIDDMGEMLAAADLVLSRAGASSIAEIAALGVPSVLVPYPFATADHQTTNARYLVDAGAALLVTDDAIDSPEFSNTVLDLLDDPERRQQMRDAARGLAQDKAASALADEVLAVASAQSRR